MVLKIENGDLIGAGADGSGTGVGDGIEPDEWMGEDGPKGFPERNGDPFGVVDFILNSAWEARFIRGGFCSEVHEDRCKGGKEGRNTKKPPPLSRGNSESKECKTCEDKGGKEADGNLSKLNHEAENTGKSSAFLSGKPSCVDFNHSRATEGLKVAVEKPDERKGGECSSEGGKAENQIDGDGSKGTDEERESAANAVGEKAVDQLPCSVREGPDGEHVGDLGCGEVELRNHAGGGKAEVVAAHVVRGVEQTDGDPVPCSALAEARGVVGTRE